MTSEVEGTDPVVVDPPPPPPLPPIVASSTNSDSSFPSDADAVDTAAGTSKEGCDPVSQSPPNSTPSASSSSTASSTPPQHHSLPAAQRQHPYHPILPGPAHAIPYLPPRPTSDLTTPPQVTAGRTLLLFVHGFLGSDASFGTFPSDLVQSLRFRHRLRDIECRMLPTFDSKGNITKAVNHLCNWLILNSSAPEFDNVVILAHSMGGLLAIDAYRRLYALDEVSSQKSESKEKVELVFATDETDDLDTKADGPSNSSKSEKGLFSSKPRVPTNSVRDPFRPNVNIIAIISFDSPFFGLSPSVYTTGVISSGEIDYFPAGEQDIGTKSKEKAAKDVKTASPLPDSKDTKKGKEKEEGTGASSPSSIFPTSLAALQNAALRNSRSAVSALPGALYQGAKSLPTTALPGAAVQGAKSATQLVAALPTAAAEGAKSASQMVAAIPNVAAEGANYALETAKTAGNDGYGTNAVAAAVPPTVSAKVREAAANALPGIAMAGTAAAISAVPYGIGLAASIIPRLTWGRMAIAGVGAVVATATDTSVLPVQADSFTEPPEEEGKGDQEATDEHPREVPKLESGTSAEDAQTTVDSQPALEAATSQSAVSTASEEEEPNPVILNDAAAPAEEAAAETAGLETAVLIAAAALAHSAASTPSHLLGTDEYSFTEGKALAGTATDAVVGSDPAESSLDRVENIDQEVGLLLKRISRSLSHPPSVPDQLIKAPSPIPDEPNATEDLVEGSSQKDTAPAAPAEPLEESSKESSTAPTAETTATEVSTPSASAVTETGVATETAMVTTANASSSWMPWVTLGVAGATLAAGAYYSGWSFAWAIGNAGEASRHLQFLYPLWGETQDEWIKRINGVQAEVDMGRLAFKCFYIELPPLESTESDGKEKEAAAATAAPAAESAGNNEPAENDAPPSYSESEKATAATAAAAAPAKGKPKPKTPAAPLQPRTFINPPPQSAAHLFRAVPCDSDEIAGHMMIFDRSENAVSFWIIVDETAAVVAQALRTHRARLASGEGSSKVVRVGLLPV
ncbi:hypothetical protein DFJ73DRAFT_832399 [Zopfochytrium polystomum]|nr:hypothetical protein DFJ73DRAFT_832399 [Zopfochytrium polystomum]